MLNNKCHKYPHFFHFTLGFLNPINSHTKKTKLFSISCSTYAQLSLSQTNCETPPQILL